MRRDLEEAAVCAVLALAVLLLGWACLLFGQPEPRAGGAPRFSPAPADRAVLESPQLVYEARVSGVSEVRIGGERVAVEGLPEEYVDYASWRVRMP